MTVLLLSNAAPNYHYFFNALCRRIMADGVRVVAAVDSPYSRDLAQLDTQGFAEVRCFAAHFREHRTDSKLLARYGEYDLNAALLADFERSEVYGVFQRQAGVDFYDRLKSALLSFFEDLIDRNGVKLVLYESVSNALSHFAWFVAHARGVPFAGLISSRLPGRYQVNADPVGATAVDKAFAAIRAGRATVPEADRAWVRDYIAGIEGTVPDYMKIGGLNQLQLASRYLRRDRLGQVARLIRYAGSDTTGQFMVGNPLRMHFNLLLRNVARRLRSGRVRKLYEEPVEGERFLLYPLHFHPESSTSVLAGPWLDESEVIRNIAFSLPEGLRLYVKDHISAWAFPKLEFYRRLKRLPNVRLLPPEAPTKALIRKSAAVITLTSTVGWEALLMRRRVLLYGRVFYESHQGVTRISDIASLRALITHAVQCPVDWDAAYNEDFVAAYRSTTLPGTLNLMQDQEGAAIMAAQVHQGMLSAGLLKTAVHERLRNELQYEHSAENVSAPVRAVSQEALLRS